MGLGLEPLPAATTMKKGKKLTVVERPPLESGQEVHDCKEESNQQYYTTNEEQ